MARSRSARLGYDGEHAVELYLNNHGIEVYRPRAGSARDKGDLVGAGVVISVKNWGNLALAEWLNALPAMCRNARLPVGVVWHKRRNRASPGEWYVTMNGATFLTLLRAYRVSSIRGTQAPHPVHDVVVDTPPG
jgi:hypothetical protein